MSATQSTVSRLYHSLEWYARVPLSPDTVNVMTCHEIKHRTTHEHLYTSLAINI